MGTSIDRLEGQRISTKGTPKAMSQLRETSVQFYSE
jgi:hypothetical protein